MVGPGKALGLLYPPDLSIAIFALNHFKLPTSFLAIRKSGVVTSCPGQGKLFQTYFAELSDRSSGKYGVCEVASTGTPSYYNLAAGEK